MSKNPDKSALFFAKGHNPSQPRYEAVLRL